MRRLARLAVVAALIGVAAVLRDRRITQSERQLGIGAGDGPGPDRA